MQGVWCAFLVVLAVLSESGRSDGAKILCVSHQYGSHMLMVHTIAEGMIKKGHEVYTILSDKMTIPPTLEQRGFKILRYHTPEGSTIMANGETAMSALENALMGKKPNMRRTSLIAAGECKDMDNDVKLDKTIRDLNFDLLLIDMFPLSSCLFFMTLKYEIPFVTDPSTLYLEMMRTPILPSFIPMTTMLASDNMSFIQRAKNLFFSLSMTVPLLCPFPSLKDTTLIQKYSKDPDVTTWTDVARKAELFLVSRGSTLEYPEPLTPNVINVECLTCKPAKPLKPDVKALVDNSEGVIIFSFGSGVSEFPDAVADKFLKAFAQRNETVIMRYTGKFKTDVPANVKVLRWLPQNDLLGHPKTKLFITHAGNNGQYESVYHGVPMVCFPLYAEQPHNAFRIVDHGFGLKADLRTFTSSELAKLMADIIENPSYRERTQKASRILKSAPMGALEKANYWMEHILEFGGDHLHSYGLKMPWYAFYMVDILVVVELCLVVLLCLLVGLCVGVCRCVGLCGTRSSKVKTN